MVECTCSGTILMEVGGWHKDSFLHAKSCPMFEIERTALLMEENEAKEDAKSYTCPHCDPKR